jgi:hypothetical protein
VVLERRDGTERRDLVGATSNAGRIRRPLLNSVA